MITRRVLLQSAAAAAAYSVRGSRTARAENAPGVTDTEIKIGQTMPYSGPASAYGVAGRTEIAYFKMINDQGGVNGRKINLISLDDAYSPPKTVEQVRRLVEQEHVAFLANTLGTPTNAAIRQYCNDNKVPQLFVLTGAAMFSDPQHFPWTIRRYPSYLTEGRIYAKHILATKPDAKMAMLYQNDDFGKDYLTGLKDGLGPEHAGMIVKEASYEVSEPTVDSQIVTLHGSGADVLVFAATPKFAAQAIRKAYDIGWNAGALSELRLGLHRDRLKPAGLEKSKRRHHSKLTHRRDRPAVEGRPRTCRHGRRSSINTCRRPSSSTASRPRALAPRRPIVQVLKQCGNDLSRENIMRQAANLKDFHAPLLYPGIVVNTSPTNYSPIRELQLATFTGEHWEPVGDVLSD